MKKYIIYGWKFPCGDIKYIGQTCRPSARKSRYLRKANPSYNKTHNLREIHNQLRAVWPHISQCQFVVIIDNLTKIEANYHEKDQISKHNTYINGFNKTKHG